MQTGARVERCDKGDAEIRSTTPSERSNQTLISQEPTPVRSKRARFQTASHRSFSLQGDCPQGINTVNTAKSVSRPTPVLDVTGQCKLKI